MASGGGNYRSRGLRVLGCRKKVQGSRKKRVLEVRGDSEGREWDLDMRKEVCRGQLASVDG